MNQRRQGREGGRREGRREEREGAQNAVSLAPSFPPSLPPTRVAAAFCSLIAKSPAHARRRFPCPCRAYDMTTTH